jgi:hypothetical protein
MFSRWSVGATFDICKNYEKYQKVKLIFMDNLRWKILSDILKKVYMNIIRPVRFSRLPSENRVFYFFL